MKRTILAFSAIVLMASCGNNETSAHEHTESSTAPKTFADSLYREVMEGHDVGMAKMGELIKNKKLVQQQLDSLDKVSGGNTALITALKDLEAKLTGANELMEKWMEGFDAKLANNGPDREVYLQSEKEKVTVVKDAILNSLTLADSLLAK